MLSICFLLDWYFISLFKIFISIIISILRKSYFTLHRVTVASVNSLSYNHNCKPIGQVHEGDLYRRATSLSFIALIFKGFIYLFTYLITPLSRIFHFYDGGHHYGVEKPGSGRGKPTAIRRLLPDLQTYGRSGNQHGKDLNSQRQSPDHGGA